MVGAPGAGKGTQAALLSERLGTPRVASGDLFRDQVRRRTALGKKVESLLERGALVPDDVTIELVGQRLLEPDAADGAILDGFPRTRKQAEALDRLVARHGGSVGAALYVDVERAELMRRLSGRWICSKSAEHVYNAVARPPKKAGECDFDGASLYQRDDDRPETVAARLELQLPPMYEVVDYYTEKGVLSTVNGDQPVADVTEALMRAIAQPAR